MEHTTFSIYNDAYKMVSSGLIVHEVMYCFVEKGIDRSRFFIRDSYGLDMKFNEFLIFYYGG